MTVFSAFSENPDFSFAPYFPHLFHPFFIPISTIFYFVLPSGRLIFRVDATVPPYFRYSLYSPVRR